MIRVLTNALLRWWASTFGHDVFVSYSRRDGLSAVRALVAELERRFLVFFDEHGIDNGEHLPTKIENALRRTRVLVVVATTDSLSSKWVPRECEAYLRLRGRGARVAPIFVEPVNPDSLPANWQWLKEWSGSRISTEDWARMQSDPASAGAEFAAAIGAMPTTFRGARQRRIARGALAATAILFVVIPSVLVAANHRTKVRGQLLQQAAAGAAEQRYTEATHAAILAQQAAGGDAETSAVLAEYSRHVLLRPCASVRVPASFRLVAVASVGDEPRFVLHDVDRKFADDGRIAIAGTECWLDAVSAPHESQPQCAVATEDLFLLAAGRVHRVPTADPSKGMATELSVRSGRILGGFDSTEIAVADGRLRVLARADDVPRVIVYDATSLRIIAEYAVPEDADTETMVVLSRRSDDLAFVVRWLVDSNRLSFHRLTATGELVALKGIDPGLPRSHVASIYTLHAVALAPGDRQVFVGLHELNLAGAPDSRANGVRWVAQDLQLPRHPLVMEPGVESLRATEAASRYEAVYRRDSGELRALECKDLVVLDRPAVTVHGRAMAWTIAAEAQSGTSFRAFVADREDLVVIDDTRPKLRAAWRAGLEPFGPATEFGPDPLRLLTSADGRFLVLEVEAGEDAWRTLLVWRVAGPSEIALANGDGFRGQYLQWRRTTLPEVLPTCR